MKTKYAERFNIIKNVFKNRVEFFRSINVYQNVSLNIDYFIPFIEQRANREVLNKSGRVKTSLIIEVEKVILSTINAVLDNTKNN